MSPSVPAHCLVSGIMSLITRCCTCKTCHFSHLRADESGGFIVHKEACSLVIDYCTHCILLAVKYLVTECDIAVAHLKNGFQHVFSILCECISLLIGFIMIVLTLDIIQGIVSFYSLHGRGGSERESLCKVTNVGIETKGRCFHTLIAIVCDGIYRITAFTFHRDLQFSVRTYLRIDEGSRKEKQHRLQ